MTSFEKAIKEAAAIEQANSQTGRTTRLVDQYIQELFTKPGEWIHIKDHDGSNTCWNRLKRRLALEHSSVFGSTNFEIHHKEYKMRIQILPMMLARIEHKLINGDDSDP